MLLEIIYVHGAEMDDKSNIRQFNQPTMNIIDTPYQDIKPLWRQALVRNRTAAVCGTRKENEGLREIDDYASRPRPKKFDDESRMMLDIVSTGAGWNMPGILGRTGIKLELQVMWRCQR